MGRLWEAKHAYYCNDGNFYSNDCTAEYNTWGAFISAEGESDLDMNLVFRWDWHEGDDWGLGEFNGDDYYRHAEFHIYFVGQRKGLFRSVTVSVCRADEPAIIEYLAPRFAHLIALWLPIAPPSIKDTSHES